MVLGFCNTYTAIAAILLVLVTQSTGAFSVLPPAVVNNGKVSPRLSQQLGLFNAFGEVKKAIIRQIAGDYDQTAIRTRLDSLIADNPVLVLTFETCPFCIKAKEVLDAKGTKYTEIDLTKDPDGKALRAEMGEMIGRTSVPAVWINGKFIGGCNEGPVGGIVTLNDSGKLDPMLAAAGAI